MTKRTLLLIIMATVISAPAAARTLIVGIDLSGSSAIVRDDVFAQRVADVLAERVRNLEYRDTVRVRTLGEYETRRNPVAFDATLNTRYRPDKVAHALGTFIAGIPQQVQAGTIVEEEATNILGFLENHGAGVDCRREETRFVLITDGLEYSQLGNSYSMARSGTGDLRDLPFTDLAGCHLEMWGFGVGLGPADVRNLRGSWQRWAEREGLASVSLRNDW